MNSDTDRDQNITKAKKEVERLDAEEANAASPSTNGHSETKASATPEETSIIAKEVELIKGVVANAVAEITGASVEDKSEAKVEEKSE